METQAVSKVLGTYELLEIILKLLPARDILAIQAVCKSWKAVVARSKTIQQLLFQQSAGEVLTPSKIEVSNDFTAATYSKELVFNRLLHSKVKPRRWRPGTDIWISYVLALQRPTAEEMESQATFSYLKMFLTEPPSTTAMVVISELHGDNIHRTVSCSLRDPKGLSIGLLMETAGNIIFKDSRMDGVYDFMMEVWLRMPVSEASKIKWTAEREERRKRRAERRKAAAATDGEAQGAQNP